LKKEDFYKLVDLQLYQKILPKFRVSWEKGKIVVEELLVELFSSDLRILENYLSLDNKEDYLIEFLKIWLRQFFSNIRINNNDISISRNWVRRLLQETQIKQLIERKILQTLLDTNLIGVNNLIVLFQNNRASIVDILFQEFKNRIKNNLSINLPNNFTLEQLNRFIVPDENNNLTQIRDSLLSVLRNSYLEILKNRNIVFSLRQEKITQFTNYPKTFKKLLDMLENCNETWMIDYWS